MPARFLRLAGFGGGAGFGVGDVAGFGGRRKTTDVAGLGVGVAGRGWVPIELVTKAIYYGRCVTFVTNFGLSRREGRRKTRIDSRKARKINRKWKCSEKKGDFGCITRIR